MYRPDADKLGHEPPSGRNFSEVRIIQNARPVQAFCILSNV